MPSRPSAKKPAAKKRARPPISTRASLKASSPRSKAASATKTKAASRRSTATKSSTRRPTAPKRAAPAAKKVSHAVRSTSSASTPPPLVPIWALDVPFSWRAVASAAGARWDASVRQTVYHGMVLPPELRPFAAPAWSTAWHAQNRLNGRVLDAPQPALPVFRPRPHQDEGIAALAAAYVAGAPGFLLADDVGVGKTLTVWGFALKTPDIRSILVVTTASAQAHWRATVRHAGWRADQDLTIINYDRLGALFEEPADGLTSTRAKGKRKRIAKQGIVPAFDLVVFDESHKGKNPDSARGVMMRRLGAKARFAVYASATAGQNPLELVYLARQLAYASGARSIPSDSIKDFAGWCRTQGIAIQTGAYGALVWDKDADPSAAEHFRALLFDPPARGGPVVSLRRLPSDVRGWPALVRGLDPVTLDPAAAAEYGRVWDDFCTSWRDADHLRRDLAPGAPRPSALRDLQNAVERNRMRLRQESSLVRVADTADRAVDLLEQSRKVAISVAFRDTLEQLAQNLEARGVVVARIFGGLSTTEKEFQRQMFQGGPAQVVVFTVEEAISLHQGEVVGDDAPRVLLIHDLRWSAIQMAQIEGRCHRDGKEAPVRWLVAENTVEEDIAAVLVERVRLMKTLHGDQDDGLADIDRALTDCMLR